MIRNIKKIILYLLCGTVIIISILYPRESDIDTLKKISRSGKLTVITDNNANTYYFYKDRPMGFEYDLTKAFADYLGVELEIITPGWDSLFELLNNGHGDIIAANMTITQEREKIADFSDEYLSVQQRIILHKNSPEINEINDLNGKEIHVRAGTTYHERLSELINRGLEIKMVLHNNIPTEELIRRVAEKEIEITVSDSNIALLNRRYYPEIRIDLPIEEEEYLGWAFRKGDERFRDAINSFLSDIKGNGTFGKIYERYYANVEIFDYMDMKKFHERIESRLPKYEAIIRKEAAKYGFDWRIIAALIYQESHFNPKARSHAGARGLMQLIQRTARAMGVRNRSDPVQSVRGGVKYLFKMYEKFNTIPNKRDRMLFALASYNIGYGHVRDAQKIARKLDLNECEWASVEETLPLLRERRYYKDTRFGYARGTEPVRHVNNILTYYDILKRETLSQGEPAS